MSRVSGKFVLRVGEELHKKLNSHARARGVSLNSACVELLRQALELKQAPASLPFSLPKLFTAECSLSRDVLGIVLYGSQARGEATQSSDIDVLVVVDEKRRVVRAAYTELDKLFEDEPGLSIMLVHPPQGERCGSVWLEAAQDGMVLFDRDGRIASILARVRRFIASGRVRRREAHGQGYWVYAQ